MTTRFDPSTGGSLNDGVWHHIASRSSWWDEHHWVRCSCGTLTTGDTRDVAIEAWRAHTGGNPKPCCCPVEIPTDTQCVPCRRGHHTECVG